MKRRPDIDEVREQEELISKPSKGYMDILSSVSAYLRMNHGESVDLQQFVSFLDNEIQRRNEELQELVLLREDMKRRLSARDEAGESILSIF
jgi:hypothetical protein